MNALKRVAKDLHCSKLELIIFGNATIGAGLTLTAAQINAPRIMGAAAIFGAVALATQIIDSHSKNKSNQP